MLWGKGWCLSVHQRGKMSRIKYSNIRAAQEDRLPILAVDMDGTLLEHTEPPHLGEPIPGMVEELQKLRAAGWIICVWTCRQDTIDLRKHLDRHGIPYDYVNESPFNPPDNSDKIQADLYLDDKSLNFNGKTEGLAEQIMYFRPWHKEK